MKSRIGELVSILLRAKSKGARLTGKSAFERELTEIIGAPHTFGVRKELDNSNIELGPPEII